MRILVTGGYGFIGSQVTATLNSAGHEVIIGAHDLKAAVRHFPNNAALSCDFIHDTNTDVWLPRLQNIDAVVNCVGILQSHSQKVIEAIHYQTPKALVDACVQKGVQKFIHLSARGATDRIDVPYSKTKFAFEKYLNTLEYDWIILRPSLVYGPGASGGTALFRALAAMPGIIPVVGDGGQVFQPIHIRDLSESILILLDKPIDKPRATGLTIDAVGPESKTVESILKLLRLWLGFGEAPVVHIPLPLIRFVSYFGDWFREIPINTTSYKMLSFNEVADAEPLIKTVGFRPATMEESFMMEPSTAQDRWHARLYFLKPLLRVSIGLLWLLSGLIPLFIIPQYAIDFMMSKAGLSGMAGKIAFYSASGVDILLGLATLANWRIKLIGGLQIFLIVFYTVVFSFLIPLYWMDPMGGYVKNIPLLIATMIMMAMAEDR